MKSKAADRLKRLADAYASAHNLWMTKGSDEAQNRLDAARKALHDAIDLTVSLKEPLEWDDL